MAEHIEDAGRGYISICTVHEVVAGIDDPELQAVVNQAWLTTPDGMPLVWWGRRKYGLPVSRVYGPDLLEAVMSHASHRGTRHFFFGGTSEAATQRLVQKLRVRYPESLMVGAMTPSFQPLDPAEEDAVVQAINASGADVVWVGLGGKKQLMWMKRYRRRLDASLIVGVGAAFDFVAGIKRQAPRWMQRAGLEWLFRLLSEPRRLWRRYFVCNTRFILHTLASLAGLGRYAEPTTLEKP